MPELTVSVESTEYTRILRYWPGREATADKSGRPYRVEQCVSCDECIGLRTVFDDEGFPIDCDACGGNGYVWTPLHWVERRSDASANP